MLGFKGLDKSESEQILLSFILTTYAYVTYRDIRDVKHFKNRTVIAIKAPPETRLEVPDPKEVTKGFFSLYITLFYKCTAVHVN